ANHSALNIRYIILAYLVHQGFEFRIEHFNSAAIPQYHNSDHRLPTWSRKSPPFPLPHPTSTPRAETPCLAFGTGTGTGTVWLQVYNTTSRAVKSACGAMVELKEKDMCRNIGASNPTQPGATEGAVMSIKPVISQIESNHIVSTTSCPRVSTVRKIYSSLAPLTKFSDVALDPVVKDIAGKGPEDAGPGVSGMLVIVSTTATRVAGTKSVRRGFST
ncbi:hypothetical protein HOY82DRAFT_629333, partial [Tuber indicum]